MYKKTNYLTDLIKYPYSYGYTNDTFDEAINFFPVDITETDEQYTLIADLPGFKKENIHISYDRDTLRMHGFQQVDVDEIGSWVLSERVNRSFNRSFILKGVDESKIHAKFENGVLQMTLPKDFSYDTDIKYISIN